jgi:hypothetical protein
MAEKREEVWCDEEDADDSEKVVGFVQRVEHTCVRIIHGNAGDHEGRKLTPEQPAAVLDGSGYQARLVVLPTFGCVLHEPG